MKVIKDLSKVALERLGRTRSVSAVVQMIIDSLPEVGQALVISKAEYANLHAGDSERSITNGPKYRELRNNYFKVRGIEFETTRCLAGQLAKDLGVSPEDEVFQLKRVK